MGRLFLSPSYRSRAREGEWDAFFSHHPIDLGPGRESGTSFSLIILRPRARRESGTSFSLIIL